MLDIDKMLSNISHEEKIKGQKCCGTCNASIPTEHLPKGVLLCRARPPVPLLVNVQQQRSPVGRLQFATSVESHFPPVNEEAWCREWQPKGTN